MQQGLLVSGKMELERWRCVSAPASLDASLLTLALSGCRLEATGGRVGGPSARPLVCAALGRPQKGTAAGVKLSWGTTIVLLKRAWPQQPRFLGGHVSTQGARS
jgi:hypothetical protein